MVSLNAVRSRQNYGLELVISGIAVALILAAQLGAWPWLALLGLPLVAIAFVKPSAGIYLLACALPLTLEFNVGVISSSGGERVAYATLTRVDLPLSLSLYDALLISTWLGWLLHGVLRRDLTLRVDRVAVLGLAFAIFAVASAAFVDRDLVGAQQKVALFYAAKFLEIFSIYILARSLLTPTQAQAFAGVWIALGLVVAAVGGLTIAFGRSEVLGLRIVQDRVNFFGYLVLVIPLAVIFALRKDIGGVLRGASWLLLIGGVIIAAWNGKVLVALGSGVGLGTALLLQRRWLLAMGVGALGAVIVLVLFDQDLAQRLPFVSGRWVSPDFVLLGDPAQPYLKEEASLLRGLPIGVLPADTSTVERIQKLLAGLREVPNYWWGGFGFWSAIFRLDFDPHNLFVRLLLEMGVMGLGLYIILMREAFRVGRVVSRYSPSAAVQGLGLGIMAATVGLVMMGIAGDSFYAFQLMGSYWLMVAVVGTLAQPLPAAHTAVAPPLKTPTGQP